MDALNRKPSLTWAWQLIPITILSLFCIWLAQIPSLVHLGISPLSIAIVLGVILGHTLFPRVSAHLIHGVNFSKAKLLRLGIILYGLRLTLAQVAFVGWPAILADLVIVVGTMALALYLGHRMGMDMRLAALVGSGSAICGAAAVLAAQPVIENKESDVGVAVATVIGFGTLAMFLYPLLAASILPTGASLAAYFSWGIYTGSSIHEVAQVAAAGASVNPQVADIAVITKMIRVMMLAPFLLVLPYIMRHIGGKSAAHGASKIVIPWFAIGFMVMVGFNSLVHLPNGIHHALLSFDTFLLTMAMFCLGLTTHWQTVRAAGSKPLLLALGLWVWLLLAGGLVSYAAYWVMR